MADDKKKTKKSSRKPKGYIGFKSLEKKLAKGGASNPGALAAYIGRKKYGAKRFNKAAAAGKPVYKVKK